MPSFPLEPEDVGQGCQHKEKSNKGSQQLQDISDNIASANERSSSKSLIPRFEAEVLFLQTRSKFSANSSRQLLLQFYSLEKRIPKQLITLDEKYISRCLQMMHVNAVRAATGNLEGGLYDCHRSPYTLTDGNESVTITPMDDEILGSITGCKSMMNILDSPLLKQFGNSDSNVNTRQAGLIDAKGSEYIGAEEELYGSRPMHETFVSMSSSNSTFSDQSSSVSSNCIFHAMLHCTWKDGFPRYIFSIDDQRDVYAANLYKVVSPDDSGLDYVYMFHSRSGRKLEYENNECESRIVGKMKVSTLVTPCSNIAETQFVLFGSNDNCPGETHTSGGNVVKNKALRRKVSHVFRSDKRKNSSKISGTGSSTFEDTSDESCNTFYPGGLKLIESDYVPNLELAAIIVKDYLPRTEKKPKTGGWGLKFLTETSSTSPFPPSECSTSMDVLIPAGFHGGPRTQSGGPSSLTERFRSGGHCDCGGWDIGCPLTVLTTGSKECKTFDLFKQGSKQSIPTMKMTNIHDGLYYIHFQSVLSALQVFSIATAVIHSRSPSLKHKVDRNL